MRHLALGMLVLLQVVAVLPAGAAEFVPSWDLDGSWNSNVLRVDVDEKSSFSLRTGPTVRFRERQGDLVYDVNYSVLYEAFAQIQGINAFDQYANLQGGWNVTPSTTVEAANDLAYVSGFNETLETTGNIAAVTPGRTRIFSNNSQLSVRHRFGPLWEFTAAAADDTYDYQDATQSDTHALRGTLQLTRAITPRLIAGVGAQYQRQEFDAVPQNPANGTTFYQGFGVLNYLISPTWRLTAQAGPAWAVPDQISINTVDLPSYLTVDPTTCPTSAEGTPVAFQFPQSTAELCSQAVFRSLIATPTVPAGSVVGRLAPATTITAVPFVGDQNVQGSLNYFGQLMLEKDWRLWHLKLQYSRSASNSSGLSTSTALDQLLFDLTWKPTRHWTFELSANYSTQTSVNDVRQREIALIPQNLVQVVDGVIAATTFGIPSQVDTGETIANAVDVTTYRFQLTAVRRISRRLSVDAGTSFWQQTTSGVLQDTTTTVYRFNVGVTWTFDPIPL